MKSFKEYLIETAAWTRKEGKNPEGGLNQAGVDSYNRENPGSNLKTAVTTPPSKLKKGSKAAKRRKSFCARMGGMRGPMKDENGKPTRKALSLRKWNCQTLILLYKNLQIQNASTISLTGFDTLVLSGDIISISGILVSVINC